MSSKSLLWVVNANSEVDITLVPANMIFQLAFGIIASLLEIYKLEISSWNGFKSMSLNNKSLKAD